MIYCVDLPWPPKELSPNARAHWGQLSKKKAAYRHACAVLSRAAGIERLHADALHVTITFIPPTRHRRDLDNMLASIKSGLDGLADVVGVDDSRWSIAIRKAECRTGGAVRVEVVA